MFKSYTKMHKQYKIQKKIYQKFYERNGSRFLRTSKGVLLREDLKVIYTHNTVITAVDKNLFKVDKFWQSKPFHRILRV